MFHGEVVSSMSEGSARATPSTCSNLALVVWSTLNASQRMAAPRPRQLVLAYWGLVPTRACRHHANAFTCSRVEEVHKGRRTPNTQLRGIGPEGKRTIEALQTLANAPWHVRAWPTVAKDMSPQAFRADDVGAYVFV